MSESKIEAARKEAKIARAVEQSLHDLRVHEESKRHAAKLAEIDKIEAVASESAKEETAGASDAAHRDAILRFVIEPHAPVEADASSKLKAFAEKLEAEIAAVMRPRPATPTPPEKPENDELRRCVVHVEVDGRKAKVIAGTRGVADSYFDIPELARAAFEQLTKAQG